MAADDTITFFYAPHTRANAVRVLLEELRLPYDLHVLNMQAGEQRQAAYMAINPMGKVPAIRHRGALVTELVAVMLYLADLPPARLAPGLGDPLRGPYLRWMVFYNSCFEPALGDKFMKVTPAPMQAGYGDFDTMFATLVSQLRQGPFILGERMTAADILWATSLRFMTQFKMLPETPEVPRYIAHVCGNPSFAKADAAEAALLAEHETAARGG